MPALRINRSSELPPNTKHRRFLSAPRVSADGRSIGLIRKVYSTIVGLPPDSEILNINYRDQIVIYHFDEGEGAWDEDLVAWRFNWARDADGNTLEFAPFVEAVYGGDLILRPKRTGGPSLENGDFDLLGSNFGSSSSRDLTPHIFGALVISNTNFAFAASVVREGDAVVINDDEQIVFPGPDPILTPELVGIWLGTTESDLRAVALEDVLVLIFRDRLWVWLKAREKSRRF